jgi:4,5-DOPA dioxygenase extradiol
MSQPRTVHDFYGFPDEPFAFEYPAAGAPDVAELVADTVTPRWVGLDRDSWWLDHGTWSVLAHLFPDADVPVVQLSINALQPLEYHLDIATRLAPLLDEGIAIIGSGNVVHNLRRIAWDRPDDPFDWDQRFNEAAIAQVTDAPGDVLKLVEHRDFGRAVPTPDHFIPLVYFCAFAAAADKDPAVLVDWYAYGSLSMTSFTTKAQVEPTGDRPATPAAARASAAPPDQSDI